MSVSFSVVTTIHAGSLLSEVSRCLNSCFDNEYYQPSEVILVGDGVKVFEQESLKDDVKSRIRFIPYKKSGLAACLNFAVQHTTTDIIARIDTDDYCCPGRFDIQIPYFLKRQLILCGGSIRKFTFSGEVVGIKRNPKSHMLIGFMLWKCPFNHPTVVFRKHEFLLSGGYNPDFARRQDYDLWWRMYPLGVCGNLREPLVNYQVSISYKRAWKDIVSQIKIGVFAAIGARRYLQVPFVFLLILKHVYNVVREKSRGGRRI
jgi:glycosyltransferase involved in cell wall biosynthesis